jgi:hypothetical protein|tara:strand:+ start:1816 stop:2463 length:648 start_codon:yes stop_codon:yes gene_type:complete
MVAAAAKLLSKRGRGRKRKARGVKAATPDQKMGAKKAGMKLNEFKKLSDAKQKRFINEAKADSKPKRKKKTKVKRSSKENKELRSLIAQQKKEMKEDELGSDALPRRRATGPAGQEVEQGDLLSKILTPKKREMSSETYKRQKRTGQRRRGEYAPPADFIGDEMGLGGRGSEMMPTGKELEELISSGFEIKKYGGKVKRRMGGQVRGYGKALRGY